MLLLADLMEEEGTTGDMHVEPRNFPVPGGDFGLNDFEGAAFLQFPENPESEINFRDQCSGEPGQTDLFGVDQKFALHVMEDLGFAAWRPIHRIGSKS